MNTPPILSIPDTTEPPSGQHGPDSGLRHQEHRDLDAGVTLRYTPPEPDYVSDETVADPAVDVTPLVQIPCAFPGCPKTLPVWTRHAENFAGWLCLEHKADAA